MDSNHKQKKQVGETEALNEKVNQLETQFAAFRDFSSSLLDAIEDILFYKDLDGIYRDCNTAFARFVGKTKSQIIGKTDGDLFTRDKAKIYREGDDIVLETCKPYISRQWVTHTDGKQRFLEIQKSLLKNAKSKPIGISGIIRDKTEHERTTKSLKESEEKYRLLIEQAADGIFVSDANNKFIEVNNNATKLTGYSKEELLQLRIDDLITPESLKESPLKIEQLKVDIPVTKERQIRRKDGSLRFVEVSAKLMRNGNLQGIVRDITERKQVEEKLSESEAFNRSVISGLADGVVVIDASGKLLKCNASAEVILGATKEQMLGSNLSDPKWRTIHEDGSSFPYDEYPAFITLRTGEPCKQVIMGFMKPDDSIAWISINTQPLFRNGDNKPYAVVASFSDITTLKETEKNLRNSHSFIDKIVNTSPTVVYIFDLVEQQMVYSNKNLVELLGYSPSEVKKIEKAIVPELLHPDDMEILEKHFQKLHQSDYHEVLKNEIRVLNKQGQYRTLQIWNSVFEKLPDGQTKQVIGTAIDITDQKNAEKLLKETNERYKLLSEATFEGIAISREGKVIDMNQQILDIFGYSQDALKELGLKKLVHPDDLDLVLSKIKNNVTEPYEHRGLKKNGAVIIVEARANTVHINEVPYRLTVIRDITHRKRIEQALKETEQKLRDILEHSTNMFYSHTPKNELTYVSPQSTHFLGCSPEEAKQRWTTFVTDHPDNKVGRQRTQAAIDTGEIQPPYNLQLKTKDNRTIWVEVREAPIVENGKTVAIVGALSDITERKRAEQALLESEERLELTLKGADLGTWDFNIRTGTVVFNERWAEMLGYKLEEIQPNVDSWKSRVHPNDLPGALRILQEHLKGKTPFMEIEHRMKTKSGGWKWILKRGKVIERDKDGNPLRAAGTHLDITERKMTEVALRNSEAKLFNALLIAKMAYWEYDVKSNLFTFNDQFYAVYKTTIQKVGGYQMPPVAYADKFVHPDDRYVVELEIKNAIETTDPNYSRRVEHRIICGSGEIGYVAVRFFIEKDERGNTITIFGANQDITDRKRAEEEKAQLESQLRRSQKLETIGTLAGGIAHDFNNILTPIMGYTDMALTSLPEDHPVASDLKQVLIGTNRAKELVAQILTFSRQIEQEPQALHVHVLIKEALKLLRPSIPTTIEIRQLIDTSCAKIYADPAQIHQVIINLCTNAFQAMEEKGGTLTIELKQVTISEANAKLRSNLKQDENIRLTIQDTGPGMDDVILERIFEPFFSTKPVGKGTGLGLSVVHGIVKSHQGEIVAASEKGKGATFHIYLPTISEHRDGKQKDAPEIAGGNESILIVDDEESVANVIKRMLERLGYSVEIKTSSINALKAFRKNPEKYDLVITDLTMPSMNGLQLARRLNEKRAGIPVILITGYGEEVTAQMQKEHGIREILGKPIVLVELATTIRKVVATSSLNQY